MKREQMLIWRERSAALEREGRHESALAALRTSLVIEGELHRESDLIRAATTKERAAADAARTEARLSRAREESMGETLAALQRSQRALEAAQAEKDRLLVELERQSREDALTGIANRRALQERLELEWVRCDRYRHPLAIALIDVDDFKRINDVHSHAVGDAVLVAIASLLTSSRRRNDIPARMGGEEFLIVFPETDAAAAAAACADLRERLAEVDWAEIGAGWPVTASIGVAGRRPDETISELLSRADEMMYRAKRSGKDRVCWDGDDRAR